MMVHRQRSPARVMGRGGAPEHVILGGTDNPEVTTISDVNAGVKVQHWPE